MSTSLISFFIEWDNRNELFDLQPNDGTFEPFFLHLFKGCVLFETLLKENKIKPPCKNLLWPIVDELKIELGIANINRNSISNDIFKELPMADNSIETAVLFTYKVRNATAHNLSWKDPITKSHYQQLYFMIACSCLHVISCLY